MEPKILDSKMLDYVDVLKVVLLYSNKMSLLPELYEIFGRESLIKFLDIFAGTTIEVPPTETLESAVRDVSIYIKLQRSPSSMRDAVVKSLAEEYGLRDEMVRGIYREVSSVVELSQGYKLLTRNIRRGSYEEIEKDSSS